jgi:TonB-dependent receptor
LRGLGPGWLLALVALFVPTMRSAEATGTVEGRVFNAASASYVENVRVSIEGTSWQTFTDATGGFRLVGIPAGEVRLRAFLTGLEPRVTAVRVPAGGVVRSDVELGRGSAGDGPVLMSEFSVQARREYNAQAIAINEQRFAPNIKSVVAGDEFGDVADGNFGIFLKFLPGVSVSYSGNVPNAVSVRGVPSENTPFTIDGNPTVSPGTDRSFNPDGLLLNDISRVEVTKTPTPDQTANSLGGAVNVVTKSAFERARPEFRYRAFAGINSLAASWGSQPGPNSHTSGWRIRPNADFSYVAPVSRSFGYTISGLYTSRYLPTPNLLPNWSPTNVNNAAGTATNPALISYRVPTNPAMQERWSFSGSLDWKFTARDSLRLTLTCLGANALNDQVDQVWNVGANPAAWGPDFTQGRAGLGTVSFNTTSGQALNSRLDAGLSWRHDGPAWKFDGSVALAKAEFKRRDLDRGLFGSTSAVLRNVTVSFQGIDNLRPQRFIAVGANGAPVDAQDVGNSGLVNAVSTQSESPSRVSSARLNARRDLGARIPFTLRAGASVQVDDRDTRSRQFNYTFVGPDRVANSADDTVSRYDLVAREFSNQAMPWGLPRVIWPSNEKIGALFRTNPEYFQLNEVAAISAAANASRKITETISAAYVRGDTRVIQNRLWLVGGVRFEHTRDDGYGVLNDLRSTFQQDARGNLIRGANGAPLAKPGTAVELARLQYTDRGAHAVRSYGDFYPSLNAAFNVTEAVIARAGWARTLGRPNFGQIIPGTTVTSPTAAVRTITVNNTGLLPWTADNFDLSLEFYPNKAGLFSVGLFAKDIRNFFGATRVPATPEILANHGLDAAYQDYEVISQTNVGDARVTGFEYNFRQSLDGLHPWLRGFGLFFNGTEIQVEGSNLADFSGFAGRTINWGISHGGRKHSVRLNWNYTGRLRDIPVEGAFVPPGTYRYVAPWMQLDVSAEYRLGPRMSVFAAVRNLTDASRIQESYGPTTPWYARLRQESRFGAMWNVGVKGSF